MVRIMHGARTAALLLAGAIAGLPHPSTAAGQNAAARPSELQPAAPGVERAPQARPDVLLWGKTLIDMDVRNDAGEKLGEVEDAMIDRSLNRVSYVAVEREDGDHCVAVPIEALSTRPTKDYLVLSLSKARFDLAPAFSKDHWPAHADVPYWRGLGMLETRPPRQHPFRGVVESPYATGPDYRLSKAIGMKLESGYGHGIGKIEDAYIDMRRGHLTYGLISFHGVKALHHQMAVVPWGVLNVSVEKKVATLEADPQTVRSVAFGRDHFPYLDAQYLSEISRQFAVEPYWEVFGYPPPRPSQMEQRHGK